ncbi:hypothetical protein NO1_0277 [Candidatus Termititenax aidoneus]|uniref:Uncharacterized protein n=1 Tax=Termititenax aidoneus TaxID=2218524 RepID=A0A388T852_TERA1|nr:hypothetical protein NO1_0277 [Candidatus Termititenax aidoneus]
MSDINTKSPFLTKTALRQLDTIRQRAKEDNEKLKGLFSQTLDNAAGKEVLEHLEMLAHRGFPNYDNANLNYAKIGQLELLKYIRSLLEK